MSRIMIVGEAWGEAEAAKGEPFVGASGSVLHGLMRQAGIEKQTTYLTNVFNLRPPGNNIKALCGPKSEGVPGYRELTKGKYILAKYEPELARLQEEIEREDPNIIIALGGTALWALCKKTGIKKYRGSPLPTFDGKRKVIPTWHPAAILRQWQLRVIALADFYKARRESDFPEIRRPSRKIYLQPSIADIEDFYHEFIVPAPFLSCDVETKARTITEVGYATPDGSRAIVIPFWKRAAADGNYWPSHELEKAAWNWVRIINQEKHLIGQNFQYDMKYFWRTMGIPCPNFLGDTMLLHHALQPEMEKGLGFLGSIYTNEPSWKFMRTDHSTLKQEDG